MRELDEKADMLAEYLLAAVLRFGGNCLEDKSQVQPSRNLLRQRDPITAYHACPSEQYPSKQNVCLWQRVLPITTIRAAFGAHSLRNYV